MKAPSSSPVGGWLSVCVDGRFQSSTFSNTNIITSQDTALFPFAISRCSSGMPEISDSLKVKKLITAAQVSHRLQTSDTLRIRTGYRHSPFRVVPRWIYHSRLPPRSVREMHPVSWLASQTERRRSGPWLALCLAILERLFQKANCDGRPWIFDRLETPTMLSCCSFASIDSARTVCPNRIFSWAQREFLSSFDRPSRSSRLYIRIEMWNSVKIW